MPTPTEPIPSRTTRPRLQAAVLVACTLGLLLFAHYLDSPVEAADARSSGLDSLGLGAYSLPGCGFKKVSGLPCASCGMTRSFTYMTEGDFGAAFAMQPAGAVLCLGVAMLALIGVWALITAMPLGPVFHAIFRVRHVVVAVAFVLAVWVFNIIRHLGHDHL